MQEIPEEVLLYYTSRNRLSKWMYSRGLFRLAGMFKSVSESHFPTVDGLREFIAKAITEYRIVQGHGVVAHFDAQTYNRYIWFARIGEGSLGERPEDWPSSIICCSVTTSTINTRESK